MTPNHDFPRPEIQILPFDAASFSEARTGHREAFHQISKQSREHHAPALLMASRSLWNCSAVG